MPRMHSQRPTLYAAMAYAVALCALMAAILALTGVQHAHAQPPYIVIQSTTSTQNSGLLDHVLPIFTDESGIEVRVVAVGTGQAIRNAANGDGDVLLVHAKQAEEEFITQGHGVERLDVMYNDFVIVGPEDDPANVSGSDDVVSAFKAIADAQKTFASRGDDSGTHKAERRLWAETGVDVDSVSGTWYRETGSGMGTTLNVGIGMGAYVMTDRATWIAFGNKANHRVLVEKDPRLFNQYGVMLVNPGRHANVNATEGQIFIDWLTGNRGQRAIANFKIDDQQLFFPNAQGSLD